MTKMVDVDYAKIEARITLVMRDQLQSWYDHMLLWCFIPDYQTAIDEEGCGAVFGAWEAMRYGE